MSHHSQEIPLGRVSEAQTIRVYQDSPRRTNPKLSRGPDSECSRTLYAMHRLPAQQTNDMRRDFAIKSLSRIIAGARSFQRLH